MPEPRSSEERSCSVGVQIFEEELSAGGWTPEEETIPSPSPAKIPLEE